MRLLQRVLLLWACLACLLLASEEPSCIANEVIRALSVVSPSRDTLVPARYYLQLSAELRLRVEEYMKIDAEVQICVTVRALGEHEEHGEQRAAPDTAPDTAPGTGRDTETDKDIDIDIDIDTDTDRGADEGGTVVHQQCGLRAFDEIQVPGVRGRNSLQVELLHRGRRLCWAQVQLRCCLEAGDALAAGREAAAAKREAFFAAGRGFVAAVAAEKAAADAQAGAEAGAEAASEAGAGAGVGTGAGVGRGVDEVLADRLRETREQAAATAGTGAANNCLEGESPYPALFSPPVLKVVVGIKSGALNLHKRQLVRKTWMASLDAHSTQWTVGQAQGREGQGRKQAWEQQRVQFVPFFLVGRYEAPDTGAGEAQVEAEAEAELVRGQLRAEQRLYGDLLLEQLPVRDSYHTLGPKLLLFLGWVFDRVAPHVQPPAHTSSASTSASPLQWTTC
jgi:hypothetical protein